MIHSLAGGKLRDIEYADFVKVQIIDKDPPQIYWYTTDIIDLKIGDKVLVPYGANNILVEGVIQKIERNLNSQNAPMPIRRTKQIVKKI